MASTWQDSLFDDSPAPDSTLCGDASIGQPAHARPARPALPPLPASPAIKIQVQRVQGAAPDTAQQALASSLPPGLRLGTSSWTFPGWAGLVWDGPYDEKLLSRQGLTAYAQHPLLRTVSIDRTFYRPLSAAQYAAYAAQVPDDFRFVVKAPSLMADAMLRDAGGRGQKANPAFLDPLLACQQFVAPALEGLGHKIGALVFQLSPLPGPLLARLPEVLDRLRCMLRALPSLRPTAPDGVIAVEVRNSEFLTPAFASVLRETGATYCLGLHPKLPSLERQLPMLRALWPGPLVCRWNLNSRHGAYGYDEAKDLYRPFDKLVDPDLETRDALARVIVGTTGAGHMAYVTANNKAEGSAPLTVLELAREVARRRSR